ncbi:Asparagine synthetase domain-containing protein 1 [Phytophthora pseudosyringae]|uniref:Asparagine synthetase domain-containing protein 1 n=1 Tax=Phytophthora pseudosyringae TaxID=221518 RepID=A0A8T1W703_9STRA|nr:Asparagine synthetase domain-containing protein 1 [Phytophthora pseudosyringae]
MCGIGLVLSALCSPCTACSVRSQACPCASTSPHPSPDSGGGPHANNSLESSHFDLELERRLCQRGPDHYQRLLRRVTTESNEDDAPRGFAIAMHSAVLHLRGDKVTPQPVEDSDDNVLCWNGEVFAMDGDDHEEDSKWMQASDTALLSDKLQLAGEKLQEMTLEELEKGSDPVVEVLRRVRGPYAMAWLHDRTKRVYFAHDRFGRRSLLYRRWGADLEGDFVADLAGTETTAVAFGASDLTRFVLSNVAVGASGEDLAQYRELPASGIYVLDLRARGSTEVGKLPAFRMEFHPYAPLGIKIDMTVSTAPAPTYVLDRFGCQLPCPAIDFDAVMAPQEEPSTLESSARALLLALSNAVGVRVRSVPPRPAPNGIAEARVAVLFSGGLDSVVLAALSHFHALPGEPVDLLTACFDEKSSFASPDRLAAELAHAELCALFPQRQWNLVQVNVPRAELSSKQHEIQTLMAPCDTHMDFNIGAAFWFLSRGRGELRKSAQETGKTTLDELNAFLKPQRGDLRELETEVAALSLFEDQSADDHTLLCPVRRCGRKRKHGCVLGVCKTCCFKMQRAVGKLLSDSENQHVDQREAQGYVAKLISMGLQSETHLDLLLDLLKTKRQEERGEKWNTTIEQPFLSCRVHRSKQEQGGKTTQSVRSPTSTIATCNPSPSCEYQTSARVVLVGIGADEQLAGYGRHRTTLINGGEAAMRAELRMDLGRIWKRNLGRDDRCIASHGRETRFPYLDENVVSTIATFPVSSLCDAQLPRGVGDKRALRLVAKTLGLRSCAGLAKRAIQFGSRIAKVSNNRSNRQTQGKNKFSSVE